MTELHSHCGSSTCAAKNNASANTVGYIVKAFKTKKELKFLRTNIKLRDSLSQPQIRNMSQYVKT